MKTYMQFYIHFLWIFIAKLFTPNAVLLANYGTGTHEHGITTKLADAATTARFLLGQVGVGSAGSTVAVCGVSDEPRYLMHDQAAAAADPVACRILGLGAGTDKMVSSGGSTFGDLLVPAAAGKVKTLPSTTGTYWVVGRAAETCVDGDEFEVEPCRPYQVSVTS